MAAMPTDITAATGGDVVVRRRRGPSKAPNFTYGGPLSVIRLELDASDEWTRRRLERQWDTVFRLRRALQRDAAARCRAYWAARRDRATDAAVLRARLGLSRKGMEAAAKAHIEGSGWMRDHLTKAVGLHLADEVWETIDRHLFRDASGRRHGPPRVGSWWEFARIPGRARSHTKTKPAWETYRLVGSLDGHLATYRHPRLPASVCSAAAASAEPAGVSILAQPARMSAPTRPESGSWRDHDAVLAVVFTGLAGGDLVLPVRLPPGAGRWLARALRAWLASQQEREGSVNRHQPPAAHAAGSARTGSHHHPVTASAEQAALGPPRTDQDPLDVAGPAERDSPPSCLALHDPLQVNS